MSLSSLSLVQGWTKPNAFHVCITSYNLAVKDHRVFKQKKWRYLVLDEVSVGERRLACVCAVL